MLSRLQMELDSAIRRSERLDEDDFYDQAIDDPAKVRPDARSKENGETEGTKLYVESKSKSINSSVRQDDIEVYLRIECFRQQLFHLAEKLSTGVKWLPYTRRFTIWKHSRLSVQRDKNAKWAKLSNLCMKVE